MKEMRALEILGYIRNNDYIMDLLDKTDIDEAISELEEAMKPKTCEGCVYGVFGVDSFGIEVECTLAYRCSRGQDDMFKQKANE